MLVYFRGYCYLIADGKERNRFPHTTFNWVGIDGSQVLCHMTPVGKITSS